MLKFEILKREESYEENEESYEIESWNFGEKWGKLWENEENLREHEESYEPEQIQLCGITTFPITFLTFW